MDRCCDTISLNIQQTTELINVLEKDNEHILLCLRRSLIRNNSLKHLIKEIDLKLEFKKGLEFRLVTIGALSNKHVCMTSTDDDHEYEECDVLFS